MFLNVIFWGTLHMRRRNESRRNEMRRNIMFITKILFMTLFTVPHKRAHIMPYSHYGSDCAATSCGNVNFKRLRHRFSACLVASSRYGEKGGKGACAVHCCDDTPDVTASARASTSKLTSFQLLKLKLCPAL